MTSSAIEIYQGYLDQLGTAVLARDAETFLARIFLPHVIETETARIRIDDMETALRHFQGFADALASQGVDEFVRVAKEATLVSDTQIAGRHETFMMSAGKLAVPRFFNEAKLELRGGIWGSTETRHFARYVSWPDILPRWET